MIVKYHSASLAILCNAITLPLSNLAYSVPALVGGADKAEPFSVFDIVGLVVTVLGLLVYQSRALRKQFCKNNCLSVKDARDGVLISGAVIRRDDDENDHLVVDREKEDEENEKRRSKSRSSLNNSMERNRDGGVRVSQNDGGKKKPKSSSRLGAADVEYADLLRDSDVESVDSGVQN